ncbi:hypothetical protein AVEN_226788-1 [Araneus ventricosus]|uniref:Uncharacterized protein n=1 Tax=Araneus ventricosus TaxID=182803 RepID=A0A4Y2Q8S3_ARAVE|nr:hypothetical protein AVEN_226788-1 [Araneus ventricosus]
MDLITWNHKQMTRVAHELSPPPHSKVLEKMKPSHTHTYKKMFDLQHKPGRSFMESGLEPPTLQSQKQRLPRGHNKPFHAFKSHCNTVCNGPHYIRTMLMDQSRNYGAC